MLGKLARLFFRLAAAPLLLMHDAREAFKDRLALVLRQDRKVFMSKPGARTASPVSHFAIVCCLPNDRAQFSLENLLAGLKGEGYFVLLISNCAPSPRMLSKLDGLYDHFIHRSGTGRDFGAYKCGIEWFQRSEWYDKVETLIIANDSLFYPRQGTARAISEMLKLDGGWGCLFSSMEVSFHAQSFMQLFRRDIFCSEYFKQFWANYRSLSSRQHCVHNGEIGLSRILLAAGFFPSAVYSAERVSQDLIRAAQGNRISPELDEILCLSLDKTPHSDTDVRSLHSRGAATDRLASLITHRMETSNPTHSVGLLVNWLYEAPLKRDLCYRGTTVVAELLRFAKGFTAVELQAIAVDLRRRATPTTEISLFQFVLQHTGRA